MRVVDFYFRLSVTHFLRQYLVHASYAVAFQVEGNVGKSVSFEFIYDFFSKFCIQHFWNIFWQEFDSGDGSVDADAEL